MIAGSWRWAGAVVVAIGLAVGLGVGMSAQRSPQDAALGHFQQNRGLYGLSNPAAELGLRKGRTDERGITHLRYDQFYKGVPVFEGEAIAHVDREGEVTVTNSLRGHIDLDVKPTVGRQAAIDTALGYVGAGMGPGIVAVLQVLPRGDRSPVDRLTWHVTVPQEDAPEGPAQWEYFVDAQNGAVLWSFNSIETAGTTGTGKTMYSGNQTLNLDLTSGVYSMRDTTRGSSGGNYTCDMKDKSGTNCSKSIISNSTGTFGNGQKNSTDRSTAGADAHFGLQKTWDYYKTTFGRNGIDGKGRRTYSRVHYRQFSFQSYENAFWSDSCFCMTYGDGGSTFYPLVSIDVAGHEMSHGVMSTEANLTYSGESGGLNESNSDIFGAIVEFYANNSQDTPDWWIGERIYKSNWSTGSFAQDKALRYMDDPGKDGRSPACWTDTIGSLNVHYSSGPNNHMFFLLADGGTSKCNGNAVAGIGRDKAAAIWYKAVTDYMTSATNYAGARTAALNAATAMYGAGSTEYNAVAAAFSAINVN